MILATACLALALWGAPGCSNEDPFVPDPVDESYPWPETADALMENLARAYEEMDTEEYEAVLHADFAFVFIDYAEVWPRATDITAMESMFVGEPGENPDGSYRTPVQSIAVNRLNRETPWEAVPGDHAYFPGAMTATCEARLVFTLAGGENTITIHSDQEFFVRSEDVEPGAGGKRTRYYLVGQLDVDHSPKSNESMTWGDVKELHDPVPDLITSSTTPHTERGNEDLTWGSLKNLYLPETE